MLKTKKIPLRYLPKKLTLKDKKKQIKMLKKSRKLYKKGLYYTRKNLKSFKSKKSNHILNAKKMYNVTKIGATDELSKKTKCSKESLAKIIKNKGNKKYNYLFAAFSGEELGLYGSKYFVEHCPVNLKSVNYMINMDMVGRLNDSTHGLTLGGFGTSPIWGKIININDTYFKIKVDSAGSGPSDHTSFYRKDIPVLFFFTRTHSDYHKPSDDADKINFKGEVKIIRYIESLIDKTVELEKIPFLKTREAASMGKSSFKVTMGIMPDYTFSGNGVLVDGVSDNRPAQKAGIKTGDVIIQLGDFVVSDVQTYMQALNKHTKGETINVKIIRGKEEMNLKLTF